MWHRDAVADHGEGSKTGVESDAGSDRRMMEIIRIDRKIKECPFCGNDKCDVIKAPLGTTMFRCFECGANVCFYGAEKDTDEAIKRWNRRANA